MLPSGGGGYNDIMKFENRDKKYTYIIWVIIKTMYNTVFIYKLVGILQNFCILQIDINININENKENFGFPLFLLKTP